MFKFSDKPFGKFITKKEYSEIEECNCGGPIFKYHDCTHNTFVVKCGYFKKVLEIDKNTKKKIWITPKKVACDWKCVYHGERPVFAEINKGLIKTFEIKNKKNVHEQLEDKLKILFKFLHVSTHSSTIQEIDILVENNLLREPRKTFYFPTIGHFMKESHKESFEEYEKRIFSKKIIDLSYKVTIPKPSLFLTNENKNKKINKIKEDDIISSQFIIVSDDDDNSDKNSESSENESDSERHSEEEDIDRGQSDFDSVYDDSNDVENLDNLDNLDDYDDVNEGDYNDDDGDDY